MLFQERIARPLGLAATTFVSLADSEARARLLGDRTVAATQLSAERHGLVLGEVDDLNAFAMGGIAGHAGLFSTAGDLAAIATALVAAFRGQGQGNDGLVARDVIRQFWSPSGVPGSTWRLGWDGPAESGSQAGERLSRAAVGHLAFTGCSLWIDPAAGDRHGSALEPGPSGRPDGRSVPAIAGLLCTTPRSPPSVMMDAE